MNNQEILSKTLSAFQNRQNCAFATVIEGSAQGTPQKMGAKMVVFENGETFSTIGGGSTEKEVIQHCLKAIKKKKPELLEFKFSGQSDQPVCGGSMKIFIEPILRQKHLIICGAGHIAWPLSLIGKLLNFKITMIDDRKQYANKNRFPHADKIILDHPAKHLKNMKILPDDYILILTPNHMYDYACLKAVINSSAGFIGVIGSHKKKMTFWRDLKKSGISQKKINHIHMPLGIDIGAQTPEEIAISIISELIRFDNKEFLGTKKFQYKNFKVKENK